MGTICSAECKCGYKTKELFLGGGRMNFLTKCNFPYFCKKCNELFIGNTYDKKIICSECNSEDVVAYNKKEMVSPFDTNIEIRSETISFPNKLSLTNQEYFCPKCHKYQLKFSFIGMCD